MVISWKCSVIVTTWHVKCWQDSLSFSFLDLILCPTLDHPGTKSRGLGAKPEAWLWTNLRSPMHKKAASVRGSSEWNLIVSIFNHFIGQNLHVCDLFLWFRMCNAVALSQMCEFNTCKYDSDLYVSFFALNVVIHSICVWNDSSSSRIKWTILLQI